MLLHLNMFIDAAHIKHMYSQQRKAITNRFYIRLLRLLSFLLHAMSQQVINCKLKADTSEPVVASRTD